MKIIAYLCCFLYLGAGLLVSGKNNVSCYHQSSLQGATHEAPFVPYKFLANTGSNQNTDNTAFEREGKKEKKEEGEAAPSVVLDKILKEDLDSKGLMGSILGGLTLFYNVLSNVLLYPFFSFLLGVMTIFFILIGVMILKKIKKQQRFSPLFVIFSSLYLVAYIDLFLVVYEKRKILLLFFQFEKEMILMAIVAFIGFIGGRFFSSKSFEEEELP